MELTLAIFLTRAVVSTSGASAEQREGSLRSKRLAKAVGSKCFRTRICPDTTEVSAKYEAERESSPGRYARAPVDSRAAPAEALGDAPAARWRYPKLMRSNLGSCMRDSILLNRRPACDHTRTLQRTTDEQLQRQLGAGRGCQHHDLHGCHRGPLLSLAEHHDARLNSVINSLGVINTKAGAKRLARRSVQRVEREKASKRWHSSRRLPGPRWTRVALWRRMEVSLFACAWICVRYTMNANDVVVHARASPSLHC